jgi:hypothetical protein
VKVNSRSKSEDPIEVYYSAKFVPEYGYRWESNLEPAKLGGGEAKGTAPLMVMDQRSKLARRYEPFNEFPSLYREFAGLSLKPDAILAFANRYGWLGIPEFYVYKDRSSNVVVQAEGLNLWQEEIQNLSFFVQLWDLRDKPIRLRNFVRWDKNVSTVFLNGGIANKRMLDYGDSRVKAFGASPSQGEGPTRLYFQVIANREHERIEQYARWSKSSNLIGPLTACIAEEVNKRLEAHVSPRVLMNENDTPVGLTVPRTLLGTLWLQFYRTLTGEKVLRKCLICKRDMDVTGSRKTKRMHDSCARREQMKRYHENKKKRALL